MKQLTMTMMKSRQVQTLPKYRQRPKAIHLRNISMVKRTAKTRLTILRMNFNSSLSWRLISSKQRDRLQIWILRAGWSHTDRLRPGGEYEEEDGPLKERVVDDVVDDRAEEIPLRLEPGSLAAGTAPAQTVRQPFLLEQ